jgi:large subunit ribosomal protein L15e
MAQITRVLEKNIFLKYLQSPNGIGLKQQIRRGASIKKITKPIRIIKARQYGYKAKPGYHVYIVKVKAGRFKRPLPVKGRRSKRYFRRRYSIGIPGLTIAKRRLLKTHRNLGILGGSLLYNDRKNKFFEIIRCDPSQNNILMDHPELSTKKEKTKIFRQN